MLKLSTVTQQVKYIRNPKGDTRVSDGGTSGFHNETTGIQQVK